MTARAFPSYRLFKDNRNRWRWRYDIRKDETIAVSSDSCETRAECEQMVSLVKSSMSAPLWVAPIDIVKG